MCPGRDEAEQDLELDPEVLAAGSGDLLTTLVRSSRDLGEASALEDMDRIRRAFESSEAAFRAASRGAASRGIGASPVFPGYTLLEKLGEGGFASVYRARDEKLGRDVALKVLHPRPGAEQEATATARFIEEARALARIRHPNVLVIHAVLEHAGVVALATELIQGQPLDKLVAERGPLSAGEAVQVGAELCRALAAVHASGLVHRDVKPANVLREKGGRIVLADFGLGVFLSPGSRDEPPEVAGSPLFMAPEQARGEAVDARTDIYGVGVLLYNISTGNYPVPPTAVSEVLRRIRSGDIAPIRDARPDIPEAFSRVVMKALSADPAGRFRSAGEMEEGLLAAAGTPLSLHSPAGVGAIPAAGTPRRPARRRWILAAAAVAFAGSIAALLMALSGRGGDVPFRVEMASLISGARTLTDGDSVQVGDALHLELRADRGVHAYVLNEDERRERHLLFPIPGGDLRNPLPGGRTHRLPGRIGGTEQDWAVSSEGGRESVYILVSAAPIEKLEALASPGDLAAAAGPSYPAVDRDALREVLRGIGKVEKAADLETGRATSALEELLEEVRSGRETGPARGLWVRRIVLKNP